MIVMFGKAQWILPSKKQIFSALKYLFLIILGYTIAFFFHETVRRYLYESPPALEYQVLSTQLLGKSELLQILYSNFKTGKVDFSMDDNILSGYYYTVVELTNKGNFLRDDLLFDLDFMNEQVKILGLLCKMIEPEERELKAEIERPPLELQLRREDLENPEVKIYWSPTQDETQRATVYRSYSKLAGFGRRNPIPIVDNSFSEKPTNRSSYYYSVTKQVPTGLESELTEILFTPVPEVVFNRSHFRQTLDVPSHNLCGEIDPITFLSGFNKAKAKSKGNLKIFVDIDRKEFGRIIPEKIDNLPVYFKDDVKFLRGKTTLRLSNIMRKAKIRFYIISKTYLKYDNHNLTLSLRDIKDIHLTKIKSVTQKNPRTRYRPHA
jgi:hypothetical protein